MHKLIRTSEGISSLSLILSILFGIAISLTFLWRSKSCVTSCGWEGRRENISNTTWTYHLFKHCKLVERNISLPNQTQDLPFIIPFSLLSSFTLNQFPFSTHTLLSLLFTSHSFRIHVMNHHIYQPRSNRGRSVKTHLLNTNKFEREREREREEKYPSLLPRPKYDFLTSSTHRKRRTLWETDSVKERFKVWRWRNGYIFLPSNFTLYFLP